VANDAESPEDQFGRQLRQMREEKGLSQAQMAQRLEEYGVYLHPSAIAKIEARDSSSPRAIRLNEAHAIAKVLGRHLEEMTVTRERELEHLAAEVNNAARLATLVNQWFNQADAAVGSWDDAAEDVPPRVGELREDVRRYLDRLRRLKAEGL